MPEQRGGRSADGPAPLRSPPLRPRLRGPAPAAPRPLRGPATRLFPARGPSALRGGRRPPSRTPTAEHAVDSPVRGSPARRRPRSASPRYSPSARRRCEGAGWRPRSSSLSPRPEPLLGADGASAPVSTRPLSSPNPRQALPGERGRAGFWHRNCSQAGAASPPGRGGASATGASGPAPGLLANPCGPAGLRLLGHPSF